MAAFGGISKHEQFKHLKSGSEVFASISPCLEGQKLLWGDPGLGRLRVSIGDG